MKKPEAFADIHIIKSLLLTLFIAITQTFSYAQQIVWKLGEQDNQAQDMALSSEGYENFLNKDFGWEDRFFLIGYSELKKDWPYILPGPKDGWGGTGPTSGIRSHVLNILFSLDKKPADNLKLLIDVMDSDTKYPPLLKVVINSTAYKFQLPTRNKPFSSTDSIKQAREYIIEIPVPANTLNKYGNEIQLTTLDGGWLTFDQVRLESNESLTVQKNTDAYIRSVREADYEIDMEGKRFQPLLVDLEYISGKPVVEVKVDQTVILKQTLETGRYEFEAPMPAVSTSTKSNYAILVNGKVVQSGTIARAAQHLISSAEYVDTRLGTAHSRWMIAPGPWMPFSMVKISPDNQPAGWMAGYDPTIESIGAFSHIHEWTMAGLGMMATNGPLKTRVGEDARPGSGYRSSIDKNTEEASLGYYKVMLKEYGIQAELTATTRASFQRYTFPAGNESRILLDLQTPAEYAYNLKDVELRKVSDYKIEGHSAQHTPRAWGKDASQEYVIHFVVEFDQPITKYGVWVNDSTAASSNLKYGAAADAGMYVEFDTRTQKQVQVRTGISYVSLENARQNLEEEISKPFGWSFDGVRAAQMNAWNALLGRLKISTNDKREKIRFFSNMYRALCSRNIFSDTNGQWMDATEKVQQLGANEVALGCDAFWNTFWNLNQFWNLVTPEWSSKWVKSQLGMYKANGWLAKGPAGMEYIPVMVAEHEIPLIVSAYQMGIRDFDSSKALEASVKMQTILPERVGGGLAGNADLAAYLKYKYVPYDKGRFSNSLEYAYDDYTVSQFAKALGNKKWYEEFSVRSKYWKNVIDTKTGYARMKDSEGNWFADFDPFKSGANEHYVEGNAWQLTFFVPQDVPGIANTIGKDQFVKRLQWGFTESNKLRFNAPGDQYWDYPVIQGNQQSMHFAFLFNWVNKPWLTQEWSRAIVDRYYGFGVANAYLGDEDQGQMSSWFIMASLGLFQTDGGTSAKPIYEIGSPLFPKVTIDLGSQYGRGKTFTIEARGVSRTNKYIQKATLNGKPLKACWFYAAELLKGGSLILDMGDKPNMEWGKEAPPVAN